MTDRWSKHRPEHNNWDAGGYCNAMVVDDDGCGDVCGYRAPTVEPPPAAPVSTASPPPERNTDMKKCTIETTDEQSLHALLDSLTDGEHVKATWKRGEIEVTTEGPVHVGGAYCACFQAIRWNGGTINEYLASFEVTRTEEITVTRDDEAALNALLDSLTDGQEVGAKWRSKAGAMILTGQVVLPAAAAGRGVRGLITHPMRWSDGRFHQYLHSVTVRRTIVHRWERKEKKEKKENVRPPAGGGTSAGTHTSGGAFDFSVEAAIHNQPNHDRATRTRCQLSKLLWGEKP